MTEPDQPTVFRPLVVGNNPEATDRQTRPSFVLLVVFTFAVAVLGVTVAALGASTGDFGLGLTSALPFLPMFVLVFWLTLHMATARGVRSIKRTVVTIDKTGLHSTIAQGEVSLPWESIDRFSVRTKGKHRIATFHLNSGVNSDSPGVRTTLPPRTFALLRNRGFQIGDIAIDVSIETLAAASSAFTNGRLEIPVLTR